MTRKNRRLDVYVPLDLTPADVMKPRRPTPIRMSDEKRFESPRARSEGLRQDRAERQHAARVSRGIDWSVCVVPGCGESLVRFGLIEHAPTMRDSRIELPICFTHASVVWQGLVDFHAQNEKFAEAVADVNERVAARKRRWHEASKAENKATEYGDLYFVRVGDLIKVGWTRDIWTRFKAYGASAELLACYPGWRTDETNLHRQLTPARAKGREWYHDEPIVQDFIARAIREHGKPPPMDDVWTQPKQVVAGKRHR